MSVAPKGKGKKQQDLLETKELKPASPYEEFHTVRVEYRVEVATGNMHATYICEHCPLRAVRVHPPVTGFDHHLR